MQQQSDYSTNELIRWSSNKLINPKTNRKIKESGKKYKEIQKKFLSNFKDGINPLLTIDNKDPISQDNVWIINESNDKVYGEIPPERLIIYQDKLLFYRGFDANSLLLLKNNGIYKHPITGDTIPNSVFEKAENRARLKKEVK